MINEDNSAPAIKCFEKLGLSSHTFVSNSCHFFKNHDIQDLKNCLFVKTCSLIDLKRILRYCQKNNFQIYPYSGGQSWCHQPLKEGVYIYFEQPTIQLLKESDPKVKAGSSVKLRDLEIFLNSKKYSFPVLTSYLQAAVGGTLSAGGFGQSSCLYGGVVDQVIEIEVLLYNGEHLVLTAKDNLFRAVLGGGGKLGFILSAIFRITPLYTRQQINIYEVNSTVDIIRLTDKVIENGDFKKIRYYKGQRWKGKYFLTFGHDVLEDGDHNHYSRIPEAFYKHGQLNIPTEMWHQQGLGRQNYSSEGDHFWQDYVIPYKKAKLFAEFLDDEVHCDETYALCKGAMLVLVKKPISRPPNSFHNPCGSSKEIHVGFGIYLNAPKESKALASACELIHSKLVLLCKELGGRPYLVGFYRFSDEEKYNFFGDDYRKFEDCKKYANDVRFLDAIPALNTSKSTNILK